MKRRHGRLTIYLFDFGKTKSGHITCRCFCDCGKWCEPSQAKVLSGHTQSCGCLHQDNLKGGTPHRIHGMDGTQEHKAWEEMRQRCNNPNNAAYADYGGRGISVCEEWDSSAGFKAFFSHIGPKPEKALTLDRIDNSSGYRPGNVRWATRVQQANNRRRRKDARV